MPAPQLFSIAPHAPFLSTLVTRVLDGTLPGLAGRDDPFALADLTIILPTRRARLALADAFTEALGGAALLPDIRTFGGEMEDEEPFLPPYDAPVLPKAMNAMKRRLLLASLVEKWVEAQAEMPFSMPGAIGLVAPPNAAEILSLAESLAELIDDLIVEGVSPAALSGIAPEELAENWQWALAFLDIALKVWPDLLRAHGEVDAAELRNQRLRRQAQTAPLLYGDRPVIAAGSTGSVPATADLLKAIASLPQGMLVLPGFDTTMTAARHEALLTDERAHGHSQYGLARLLRRLGQTPQNVVELAPAPASRTDIVRHALTLPPDTAGWAEARHEFSPNELEAALEKIAISVARTEHEQARAIAIASAEALAEGRTVGIISPDRNLARRIAAELARFEIAVADAAGTPLFQSRLGRLLRQMVAVCASNVAPVELIGLLRNRFVTLGRSRADLGPLTDALELGLLRRQRPAPGFAGLHTALDRNLSGATPFAPLRLDEAQGQKILTLLKDIEQAFAPLLALVAGGFFHPADLGLALEQSLESIAAPAPAETRPQISGDTVFAQWCADMSTLEGQGPQLTALGLHETLSALMSGYTVRPLAPDREDISIWGLLEARLQNPDLLVLAGLNETIWPEAADPGPWLSRGMRLAAGLEPPERRHGLAAHDFEMALGNKNVLLTLSERIGTSPATPSRLLQRLEAFIDADASRQLKARGERFVLAARQLDAAGPPKPAQRPAPNPPAILRPKSLRITEIETLIRSPYDLYARYVLALKALDPLGQDPGQRERGSLIHDVLGDFIAEGHDVMAAEAETRLLSMAEAAFQTLDAVPERRKLWMRRFRTAAELFLDYERARNADIAARHAERGGRLILPGSEEIVLRGRADRVDQLRDGTLELIDFKTGQIPSPGEMKSFMAPQLLAEAAIAREKGFDGVPPAEAGALTYIKIASGPEAFLPSGFALPENMDIGGMVDELIARLTRHVDAYLRRDGVPMAARIMPNPTQRFRGEFDHLARTAEWTAVDGGEEGA